MFIYLEILGELVSSEMTILRFTGLVKKISFGVLFQGLFTRHFFAQFLCPIYIDFSAVLILTLIYLLHYALSTKNS